MYDTDEQTAEDALQGWKLGPDVGNAEETRTIDSAIHSNLLEQSLQDYHAIWKKLARR